MIKLIINSSEYTKNMDRFDRQLRLWGNFGHEFLTKSKVTIIVERDDDPLFLEVQRHLLLAGISSFLIFGPDKEYVSKDTSRKNGFAFVNESRELRDLNPEINPQWVYLSWSNIQTHNLKDSSVIMVMNCDDSYPWQELSCRREKSMDFPPVLVAAIKYPLIYTHLWLKEIHFVLTTNPEYTLPDLRITEPWDELSEYIESFDILGLREEELAEVPYPVILCKAFRETLKDELYLHERLDDYFLKHTSQALTYPNYRQAKRHALRILRDSETDKHRVRRLLTRLQNYRRPGWQDEFNSKFMILCEALGRFLDRYHQLPLPSEFPDMEAGTQFYNNLKDIYMKKAREDYKIMESIIADMGLSDLPAAVVKKFCDNINYWSFLEPTDYGSSVPKIYSSTALTRFIDDNQSLISTEEKGLLEKLISCIEEHYDPSPPTDTFSATAFLGGLVAQEVIKVVTHQYVPIDNTFVYDLVSDESLTARL